MFDEFELIKIYCSNLVRIMMKDSTVNRVFIASLLFSRKFPTHSCFSIRVSPFQAVAQRKRMENENA